MKDLISILGIMVGLYLIWYIFGFWAALIVFCIVYAMAAWHER